MPCNDPVILNLWHVLAAVEDIPAAGAETVLLDERLGYRLDAGAPRVWRTASPGAALPAQLAFGYLWTVLGAEPQPLFDIPEMDEPDRRNVHTGTIGVAVSAPRAVENFLDMGHFPFVHTDILGVEPHTEVLDYRIVADAAEVRAVDCEFWQPQAAANSLGGAKTEYIYRVPHPYCSVLYKTSGRDRTRNDIVALLGQPVGEERVRAHLLMSVIDDVSSDTDIRAFQQTIFGQDKPILENQLPKRLPLDPRAETPLRSDRTSVAYRRWLAERGVRYGVIPAAAA
ncbi:MAG: aromatic ring-hydroxylating dioxygenase subunit alpha [Alphaproteobacteria bacterium]